MKAIKPQLIALIAILSAMLTGCIVDPIDDTSSPDDCYTPKKTGLINKIIDVYANPGQSPEPSKYNGVWLDTGIEKDNVGAVKKVRVKGVYGSVELCDQNGRDSSIPFALCSDLTEPKYDKLTATQFGFKGYIDELCPATKKFSDTMKYTKTGLNIEPNDQLYFEPIPTDLTLSDCDHIPQNFAQGSLTFKDGVQQKTYSSKEICQGIDLRHGQVAFKAQISGEKMRNVVTNNPSPAGNKVEWAGQLLDEAVLAPKSTYPANTLASYFAYVKGSNQDPCKNNPNAKFPAISDMWQYIINNSRGPDSLYPYIKPGLNPTFTDSIIAEAVLYANCSYIDKIFPSATIANPAFLQAASKVPFYYTDTQNYYPLQSSSGITVAGFIIHALGTNQDPCHSNPYAPFDFIKEIWNKIDQAGIMNSSFANKYLNAQTILGTRYLSPAPIAMGKKGFCSSLQWLDNLKELTPIMKELSNITFTPPSLPPTTSIQTITLGEYVDSIYSTSGDLCQTNPNDEHDFIKDIWKQIKDNSRIRMGMIQNCSLDTTNQIAQDIAKKCDPCFRSMITIMLPRALALKQTVTFSYPLTTARTMAFSETVKQTTTQQQQSQAFANPVTLPLIYFIDSPAGDATQHPDCKDIYQGKPNASSEFARNALDAVSKVQNGVDMVSALQSYGQNDYFIGAAAARVISAINNYRSSKTNNATCGTLLDIARVLSNGAIRHVVKDFQITYNAPEVGTTWIALPDISYKQYMLYFPYWIQGKEAGVIDKDAAKLPLFNCGERRPNAAPFNEWDWYNLNQQCGSIVQTFDFSEWAKSPQTLLSALTSGPYPHIKSVSGIGKLLVKIGSSDDSYGAVAEECLPGGQKQARCTPSGWPPDNSALEFYKEYIAHGKGELMFLALDGETGYPDNMGGYHIRTKRRCSYADGDRLYVYVGKNPSGIQPGDSGTIPIPLDSTTPIDLAKAQSGDHIYFGIKQREANYTKSSGLYTVSTEFEQTVLAPSVLVGGIFQIIEDILSYDGSRSIVKQRFLDLSSKLGNAVKALLVLYISFIGIGYVTGLVPVTKEYAVMAVIRIALVAQAASPDSWEFFNNLFFKQITPFINSLISMVSLTDQPTKDFTFFDAAFGALLSVEAWKKLLTVALSGPVGLLVVCVLCMAYWKFIKMCFKGLIMYAMAMMAIGFLIALFPLFLTFILFKQTRSLFDAWLKMMVGYIAQPAFYFISIGFMIQILQYAIDDMFFFELCSVCVYGILIISSLLPAVLSAILPDILICLADGWLPRSYIDYSKNGGGGWRHAEKYVTEIGELFTTGFFGMPFSINMLFFFVVILHSMEIISRVSQTMASTMVGFSYAHQGISSATDGIIESGKSFLGMDKSSKERRQMGKDMLKKFKDNISGEKSKRKGGENASKDEPQDKKGIGKKDIDKNKPGSGTTIRKK